MRTLLLKFRYNQLSRVTAVTGIVFLTFYHKDTESFVHFQLNIAMDNFCLNDSKYYRHIFVYYGSDVEMDENSEKKRLPMRNR